MNKEKGVYFWKLVKVPANQAWLLLDFRRIQNDIWASEIWRKICGLSL